MSEKKSEADVPQLTSTVSLTEQDAIRADVEKKREEQFALLGKKGQYTKAMIAQHGKEWWDRAIEMLNSDDKDERRIAFQEINKLQIKDLRTEITGTDGEAIQMNLISYAANKHTVSIESGDAPIKVFDSSAIVDNVNNYENIKSGISEGVEEKK